MNDYDIFLLENEKAYLNKALEIAAYGIDLHLMTDRNERISEEEFLTMLKAQIRIAQNIVQNDLIP
jgi:hypothetical protein